MAESVQLWWWWLMTASVLNVVGWSYAARSLRRRADEFSADERRFRWQQLGLAAVYVVVCGFRSFVPRADVQRICLVDSWLSSVTLGRSVATVAELCFAMQWALWLRVLGERSGERATLAISRVIVPAIVFAESASWYAVITTSFIGNAIEQSTWTLCGALIALGLWHVRSHVDRSTLGLLGGAIGMALSFVAFMSTVDVPMYFVRWQQQRAEGAALLGWSEGWHDATYRWVVTHAYEPWRDEFAWMALYFSVGVWISIALSHAPTLQDAPARSDTRSSRD